MIFNPAAGKILRRGMERLERAAAVLRELGHDVEMAPTRGPGSAGDIAREWIGAGAGLIVAAGGDGTINEVLEGMVHSQTPLAVLPVGTANVLAAELKLGFDPVTAAEQLAGLVPCRLPVGRLTCDHGRTTRHFLLMAGAGLDAHIVYHISGPLKARTGKLAYWLAGSRVVTRNLPQFEVEIHGRRRRCSFALISKVRNYGGDFEIAREVTLHDQEFEIVLFEGRRALGYVRYLFGMVFNRLKGVKGLSIERASSILLRLPEDERVEVQIDGEFAGRLPARIEMVPDAVTLLMPPGYAPPQSPLQ